MEGIVTAAGYGVLAVKTFLYSNEKCELLAQRPGTQSLGRAFWALDENVALGAAWSWQ